EVDLRAVDPQAGVVERVLRPVEQDVAVGVVRVLHGRLHELTVVDDLEVELAAVGEVHPPGELGHLDGQVLPGGGARDRRVGCRLRHAARVRPRVERALGVGVAELAALLAEHVHEDLVAAARVVADGERDGGGYGGRGRGGDHSGRDGCGHDGDTADDFPGQGH